MVLRRWQQPLLSPLLLALALMHAATARPCPPDAVFMYSRRHNVDVCVCTPGLSCIGSGCLKGSPEELPSFRQKSHSGYPATCLDCQCGGPGSSGIKNGAGPVYYRVPTHSDPLFDEICPVLPNAKPPDPQALRTVSWIHFPKCGSSVTSIIYNYVCQSTAATGTITVPASDKLKSFDGAEYLNETCDYCWMPCSPRRYPRCTLFTLWAPHDGLYRATSSTARRKMCASQLLGNIPGHTPLVHDPELIGSYIALFRDPRRRLLSAFNYGRHAVGAPLNEREALKATTTLEAFATFKGIAGCQTKMLLGFRCADQNVELTEDHLREATRRVRDEFAFIGITEYYTESVCLFHRMYGGSIHPHELQNLRPTDNFQEKYKQQGYTTLPKDAWRNLSVVYDAYDWEVYKVARAIFASKLDLYGIKMPEELRESMLHDRQTTVLYTT